jgi:transcriptional regulator with XRE-family HTH domain
VVKTNLGKRISVLRQAAGLTQEKLAEKTEYSVEFISMVERGINAPSVEGCERIANALRVAVKDLFDFDQNNGQRE